MTPKARTTSRISKAPEWLTVQQVAERFQVSRVTVWRWIRSGRLAGIRVGRVRRISLETLRSFTRQGQRRAGRPAPVGRHAPGTRFTLSHPLWELAGKGSGGRASVSGSKYKYVAKAIDRR
jgi:excisionase family DNA binding protein